MRNSECVTEMLNETNLTVYKERDTTNGRERRNERGTNEAEGRKRRKKCSCSATKWTAFTKETTLHGIKYSTDTEISIFRR